MKADGLISREEMMEDIFSSVFELVGRTGKHMPG